MELNRLEKSSIKSGPGTIELSELNREKGSKEDEIRLVWIELEIVRIQKGKRLKLGGAAIIPVPGKKIIGLLASSSLILVAIVNKIHWH